LNAKVQTLESRKNAITAKIEALDAIRKKSELGEARSAFAKLKNQKQALVTERKALFDSEYARAFLQAY